MKVDKDILQRYAQGECTEKERILVEEWFDSDEHDRLFTDEDVDAVVNLLDKKIKRSSKIVPIVIWSSVAAVVLIVFTFNWYKNVNNSVFDKFSDIQSIKAPVSSYAFLIMEDNSKYVLDDIQYGDTLKAKGYEITRLLTGALSYVSLPGEERSIQHTLKTEKGGLASVRLNDGTMVWLNSDSELKYSVGKKDDRIVHLQGEGYFEVNSVYEGDERQPFIVYGEQNTIQVLGTKFNVDFTSRKRIALLEGRVSVSETIKDKELDSSILMNSGQVFEKDSLYYSAEVERYIDWKEGFFDLRKLNIYDLANELSNWYRIQVEVEEGLSDKHLFGRITRHQDLIHVLEVVNEVIPVKYEWKNNVLHIYE